MFFVAKSIFSLSLSQIAVLFWKNINKQLTHNDSSNVSKNSKSKRVSFLQ